MIQVEKYPQQQNWKKILQRPDVDDGSLADTVRAVLNDVRSNGDAAIKRYTAKFDGVELADLKVSKDEFDKADRLVPEDLKKAIRQAAENILRFHEKQLSREETVEPMPGIQCWRRSVGIEKVGLYIPGGTAPLFSSLLMLGIPAKLAGCREIIICSPPDKNGNLNPAVLFTASLLDLQQVYKIGGAQAIAAMAYGTETISSVYKIFGPGNRYVTLAKQIIQQDGIAIDLPAGPSELAIYADETTNPSYIAADLLSQAEHGNDSQVLLVTDHSLLIDAVLSEIDKQLINLPRKEIAVKALEKSKIILVKDEHDAMLILNEYAPEHLILACKNAEELSGKVQNAGSVFLGPYSPEAAGDYASGTNHVLPTNGHAAAYSGVSVESFTKKITFQKLSRQGLNNISSTIIAMAEAEGLNAHANAIKIRTNV